MQDYYHAFGDVYVGHDEPSVLYYSNVPGAGNRNQWQVTLPKDPPPSVKPGRSWSFGGGGTTHSVIDDFQNNLGTNPCPAR